MVIKKDFLELTEIINVLFKSGILSSNKKVKHLNVAKYLDVFYMIMNVKELIRNIEYVKANKQNKIYVYIEKRYLKSLATLLLNELPFAKNFISIINLPRNIEKSVEQSHLLLILGSVNYKFFFETSQKDLHLIHIINDTPSQAITGAYHMHNNFDITKLVFIFALIDKILSSNSSELTK
jgi:hypothetical protein